jgi:Rrf2 family protein
MLYSAGTGYALRALAAMPEDGPYLLAKDLALKLGLPGPYLAKVLKLLAHEGLLTSVRGPHGGFRLNRPAVSITVEEVVAVMNAIEGPTACVMGFANCIAKDHDHPCPLHTAWCTARADLDQTLARVTIRDLQELELPAAQEVPKSKRLGHAVGRQV